MGEDGMFAAERDVNNTQMQGSQAGRGWEDDKVKILG
jgi:hypothetical protein